MVFILVNYVVCIKLLLWQCIRCTYVHSILILWRARHGDKFVLFFFLSDYAEVKNRDDFSCLYVYLNFLTDYNIWCVVGFVSIFLWCIQYDVRDTSWRYVLKKNHRNRSSITYRDVKLKCLFVFSNNPTVLGPQVTQLMFKKVIKYMQFRSGK